jgi:hypothetical protein
VVACFSALADGMTFDRVNALGVCSATAVYKDQHRLKFFKSIVRKYL